LTTARVKRAVKLRFTWFATVGFIRCFAHPIQRKIELVSLIIYFGMKPLEIQFNRIKKEKRRWSIV
jgi:hypothetical protein